MLDGEEEARISRRVETRRTDDNISINGVMSCLPESQEGLKPVSGSGSVPPPHFLPESQEGLKTNHVS